MLQVKEGPVKTYWEKKYAQKEYFLELLDFLGYLAEKSNTLAFSTFSQRVPGSYEICIFCWEVSYKSSNYLLDNELQWN